MNPQNHKPDFEKTPTAKFSQNPAGSQNPAHDGADTRGASPTAISAKESSERCVAMEVKDEEPKGMQEKNDKGNIEESEKEIVRYNEKDKESDATRKKKERGNNKVSEDKDLPQQAFLADACCEHEIRKDGSMSVEKGIVISISDVAIPYQHGTSLDNSEEGVGNRSVDAKDGSMSVEKGIVISISDVAIPYQHGTSLDNSEEGVGNRSVDAKDGSMSVEKGITISISDVAIPYQHGTSLDKSEGSKITDNGGKMRKSVEERAEQGPQEKGGEREGEEK
jgi:hypothetical protein